MGLPLATRFFRTSLATLALAAGAAELGAQGPRTAPDERPRALANDNRAPAGVLSDGRLSLRLVARAAMWHLDRDADPGLPVFAFAEGDGAPRIPGPLLRVRAGTEVEASIRNTLADTLVVHGLTPRGSALPDSLVIAPGATAEARFTADREGTYFYWGTTTHSPIDGRVREDASLTGAFIVDPPGSAPLPEDRVFVITVHADTVSEAGRLLRGPRRVLLGEMLGFNGKSWPHTERLRHAVGDSVRWRFINGSEAPHPLHLHGFYYRLDARGDNRAEQRFAPGDRRMAVTEMLEAGQTMSITWVPERPGGWIFHCHLTFHVMPHAPVDRARKADVDIRHHHGDPDQHAMTGMGGLVLAVDVTGAPRDARRERPRHRLRLFVDSDSVPGEAYPRFGYSLQTDRREPPRTPVRSAGPVLVLTRGEPTAIEVVNRASEATAVHWHGIELESYSDGVAGFGGMPGRVTPSIRPGGRFEARMTPPRAGLFMYHTHLNEVHQQYGGLVGPLVVLEPGQRWDPARDHVFLLSDSLDGRGVLLNGTTRPPPVAMQAGTPYRLRIGNITVDRPFVHFAVTRDSVPVEWTPAAKDGFALEGRHALPQRSLVALTIGETMDVDFTPKEPGEYMFEVRTFAGRRVMAVPLVVR